MSAFEKNVDAYQLLNESYESRKILVDLNSTTDPAVIVWAHLLVLNLLKPSSKAMAWTPASVLGA